MDAIKSVIIIILIGGIVVFFSQNQISYMFGQLSKNELGSLAVSAFAKYYKINIKEAEKPLSEYKTINDLFIRRLKLGARPIASQKIIHPTDSQITTHGFINKGTMLQAKGKEYSVGEFIQQEANPWWGSYYVTYYLCPTDYHRVHSPVDGKISKILYIPGSLYPVNAFTTKNFGNVFVKNERVIIQIETEFGPMILVMVGALNVGNMSLTFEPRVQTNKSSEKIEFNYERPIPINKGDELGLFNLGSTVVVMYSLKIVQALGIKDIAEAKVKMGEALF